MAESGKIDLSRVKYLTFEGGGGRGIIYLGVVRALEDLTRRSSSTSGPIPLFRIGDNGPIEARPYRGVTGASAGAIVAFMLALGLTSKQIEEELTQTFSKVIYGKGRGGNGRTEEWSNIESIFEEYNSTDSRQVRKSPAGAIPDRKRFSNHEGELRNWRETINGWKVKVLEIKARRYMRKLADWAMRSSLGKRVFIIGDYGPINAHPSGPQPIGQGLGFHSHNNAVAYLHSLYYNRGLFTGIGARLYFQGLIEKHLKDVHARVHNDPGLRNFGSQALSFAEFYNLTGVDLVISAVNVSQRSPRYFSVWHTPDFPVADAVAISMSIPLIFKPTFVEGGALSTDPEYDATYKGLYVDGGMLNNYPIRALDTITRRSALRDERPIKFRGNTIAGALLAVDRAEGTEGNEPFLGFRLVDLGADAKASDRSKAPPLPDDFPKDEGAQERVFMDYISALFDVFMYPGSTGQIRFKNDRERTIDINAHGWDLFDFQHPMVNRKNAAGLKKQDSGFFANEIKRQNLLATTKQKLIDDARTKVQYWVSK